MKKLLLFCIGLCLSCGVFAQVVTVKGIGTVPYTGTFFVEADKLAAIELAKLKAVERYFAENGESETENFDAIADHIKQNLDNFILSDVIIDEKNDKDRKRYTVALKVEINVPKLRNEIRKASATGQRGIKATAEGKSQLAYLFIARQVASSQAYDDRVVKRADVGLSQQVDSSRTNRRRDGSRSSSVNVDRSVRVETGGSVTRKADNVTYRILPMDDKKTAITKAFSNAGFKVADSTMILDDKELNMVNNDYSKGSDLSPSTIKMVASRMRAAGVSYLIISTLDIGAPIEDPATGQQRAHVSVSGRVLDLTSPIPSEVAAVTPQQYAGIGLDNATAAGMALKKASEAAARELVSTLNAAGIH